jgi:hypothetical protein
LVDKWRFIVSWYKLSKRCIWPFLYSLLHKAGIGFSILKIAERRVKKDTQFDVAGGFAGAGVITK